MNTSEILARIAKALEANPGDIQACEDYLEIIKLMWHEDESEAVKRNRLLLPLTLRGIRNSVDVGKQGRFYELRKKSLLIDSKACLDSYLQYLEYERDADKRFYLPRRAVLRGVIDELQRLDNDELDLLTISMPPGTGKSTAGIFFLSWIMGKYPNMPNLASAHADKLTRSFYDGVLSIITDPEYLWADVFPGVRLFSKNSNDETIDLDKSKRFKTLTCRSIEGSLTGATRCEKLLYADDLCSGIEQAMSKARLDLLWERYTNDLKSRKKQGCKELHIATRWSVWDVIGRLERQYEGDPRAKFVSIPALNESDESNFNYVGDVGYNTSYFMDMKNSLDDVSWRCLFMNQPIERSGLVFPEDDLRRYYELPEGEPDAVISVVDSKDKGTDYCVLLVAYVYGQDYYIEDCICDNGLPSTVDARMIDILLRHKVKMCQFESNAAGGRTAEKVRDGVKERGGLTHITTKYTTANKETRIIVNSTFVKERMLFKDKSVKRSEDYARMMNFLCSYTMSGRNKWDDCADAVTMLSEMVQSMTNSVVTVFKRPF